MPRMPRMPASAKYEELDDASDVERDSVSRTHDDASDDSYEVDRGPPLDRGVSLGRVGSLVQAKLTAKSRLERATRDKWRPFSTELQGCGPEDNRMFERVSAFAVYSHRRGSRAVLGTEDGQIRIWDLSRDRCLGTLGTMEGGVGHVHVLVDERIAPAVTIQAQWRGWAHRKRDSVSSGNSGCFPREKGRKVAKLANSEMQDREEREDVKAKQYTVGLSGPLVISFAIDGLVRLWDLSAFDETGEPGQGLELKPDDNARMTLCVALPSTLAGGWKFLTTSNWGAHIGELFLFDVDKLHLGQKKCSSSQSHAASTTPIINDCKVFQHFCNGEAKLRAVSCGGDREIVVWDMDKWLKSLDEEEDVDPHKRKFELLQMTGHEEAVTSCVVYDRGRGQQVLSWSEDSTLRVWEIHDDGYQAAWYECHQVFGRDTEGHEEAIHACVLFDSETQALSCSADGTLRVWDLITLECSTYDGKPIVMKLKDEKDEVTSCDVFAKDRRAISGSAKGTVHVWDLSTGVELMNLRGHNSKVEQCQALLDGEMRLLTRSGDSTRVWNLESRERKLSLDIPSLDIPSVPRREIPHSGGLCLSGDNRRVIAWSNCKTGPHEAHGRLDVSDFRPIRENSSSHGIGDRRASWNIAARSNESEEAITCCASYDNGNRLLVCKKAPTVGDGRPTVSVEIWSVAEGTSSTTLNKLVRKQGGLSAEVDLCDVHEATDDGPWAFFCCTGGKIWRWHLGRAERRKKKEEEENFHVVGKYHWSICAPPQQSEYTGKTHLGYVGCFRVFRRKDGPLFAAACFDNKDPQNDNLLLWECRTDSKYNKAVACKGYEANVCSFVVSADGSKILSCSEDPQKSIILWELEKTEGDGWRTNILKQAKSKELVRACMLFDKDSKALSVTDTGKIQVWDLSGSEVDARELTHLSRCLPKDKIGPFGPSSDPHLFPTVVIQTDLLVLIRRENEVVAFDMSRVASDVACAWSLWQLRNESTCSSKMSSREWRKVLLDATIRQPHVLHESDYDNERITLVHRLAKRTDGTELLKSIRKERNEKRVRNAYGNTGISDRARDHGAFVRAGSAFVHRSSPVVKSLDDVFDNGMGLARACTGASGDKDFDSEEEEEEEEEQGQWEITPLTMATEHRQDSTVQILLDDYRALVNAKPTLTEALPDILLPERELVELFQTFPVIAADFLRQLQLFRVRLPPTWQRCEISEGGDEVPMLVHTHGSIKPLLDQDARTVPSGCCSSSSREASTFGADGVSRWEYTIFDLWSEYIDSSEVDNSEDKAHRRRTRSIKRWIKRRSAKIQSDEIAEPEMSRLHVESREFFRKDQAWGSPVRAGVVPIKPAEKDYADNSLLRTLNYSQLLQKAVEYTDEANSMDIFDGPVLQAIIKHKWKSGCKEIHTIMTIAYVVYIILFSVVAYLFAEREDSTEEQSARMSVPVGLLLVLVTVYTLLLLYREYVQLRKASKYGYWKGLKMHFKEDPWNWFDIIAESQMLLALIFTWADWSPLVEKMIVLTSDQSSGSSSAVGSVADCVICPSKELNRTVQAIAGLLGWLKIIYFMRGFDSTAFVVNMLFQIITDMVPFVIVLSLILIAFAFAFFVLLPTFAASPWMAFVNAYAMMLGAFDVKDFDESSSGWIDGAAVVTFMCFTLLVAIVLLNAVIAIMGETFTSEYEQKKNSGLKVRADFILELEDLLTPVPRSTFDPPRLWKRVLHVLCTRRIDHCEPGYIHVLEPVPEEEQGAREEEQRAEASDLEKAHKRKQRSEDAARLINLEMRLKEIGAHIQRAPRGRPVSTEAEQDEEDDTLERALTGSLVEADTDDLPMGGGAEPEPEPEPEPKTEVEQWLADHDPAWTGYAAKFQEKMGIATLAQLGVEVKQRKMLEITGVSDEDARRLWPLIEAEQNKLVDPDMEMGEWLKMQDPSWGVYAAKLKEEMEMDKVGDLEDFDAEMEDLKLCGVSEVDATKLLERIEAVKTKLPST